MRVFLNTAIALIAILLLPLSAQAQLKYVPGQHYQIIEKPVATTTPGKIEITEVFWYGCPHCNRFRPAVEEWKKTLGDDVQLVHAPAIWRKNMETHSRIYYTMQALGLYDKMHKEIFDAMHLDNKKLIRDDEIYGLFAKHNIDRETFDKTFKSFGVNSQIKQATARVRAYGITGTPEIIVNGKYRISGRMVSSEQEIFDVANFLVGLERNAK